MENDLPNASENDALFRDLLRENASSFEYDFAEGTHEEVVSALHILCGFELKPESHVIQLLNLWQQALTADEPLVRSVSRAALKQAFNEGRVSTSAFGWLMTQSQEES